MILELKKFFVDNNEINLYASFEHYGKIQKELENRNLEILSSGFERIPQLVKTLEYEQKNEVLELIEKIEEDDDVQNVYHTLDIEKYLKTFSLEKPTNPLNRSF